MNEKATRRASKFMSLVLRHAPEKIGLKLDGEGWADVDELLSKLSRNGLRLSRAELEEVVRTNDKQRFRFSDDGQRIRANQGHSLNVDLKLEVMPPPEVLYHGTVERFLDPIRSEGLLRMSRQHVHLSQDLETATKVGDRRGKAIILEVRSGEMFRDGMQFYLSENQVWLTDHVPPSYIDFPE